MGTFCAVANVLGAFGASVGTIEADSLVDQEGTIRAGIQALILVGDTIALVLAGAAVITGSTVALK